MYEVSCSYQWKRVHRITKRVARRLFEQGVEFVICPCNLRPNSSYGLAGAIHKDNWSVVDSFDKMVEIYEWFNCNKETGLYAAYYAYTV